MKIDIEIENPNERELELISELSKIESEKAMEEKRYMEDTLLSKLPNMFQELSKKEQERKEQERKEQERKEQERKEQEQK